MRRKDLEKKIKSEADRLTPEQPPFEAIAKKIDWDRVMQRKTQRNRGKTAVLAISAGVLAAASCISGVFVGLSISSPVQTSGEADTITLGQYHAYAYLFSGADSDATHFKNSWINVDGKSVGSGAGRAVVRKENSQIFCSMEFKASSFSFFEFEDFKPNGTQYEGIATYNQKQFSIALSISKWRGECYLSFTAKLVGGDFTAQVSYANR